MQEASAIDRTSASQEQEAAASACLAEPVRSTGLELLQSNRDVDTAPQRQPVVLGSAAQVGPQILPSVYYVPEFVSEDESERLLREVHASKAKWTLVGRVRGLSAVWQRGHTECQALLQHAPVRA